MAIALKIDSATGKLARFVTADSIDVNSLAARNVAANITIGANLNSGLEVHIGSTVADTRILGDLLVDGSSTVTVNETITGTFTANGNVNLGSGNDIINIGASSGDVINLLSNLVVGAGTRRIGASVTDYLDDIWLDAVDGAGPALAAYNLNASGVNAGAYAIGVDPDLLGNSNATNLMTALDDLDAAISAGSSSLQVTYGVGNTIDVVAADGTLDFANDTAADTTTVLSISRVPGSSTAGVGLDVNLGANTTGIAVQIAKAGSGTAVQINNTGSGLGLDVQDGGTSVLQTTGAGAVTLTPTSGQTLTLTAAGVGAVDIDATGTGPITLDASGAGISLDAAGASNFSTTVGGMTIAAAGASSYTTSAGNLSFDAAAAELVFDDVGNSGITLSDATDRVLDQTAAGEMFNATTSLIGALSKVARKIEVSGGPFTFQEAIVNAVTIAAGDCVAGSTTTGRVTQCNANADANTRFIGICIAGGTGDAGGTVEARVAITGSLITDSGAAFTAGDALFLPDGTGRPTATAPSTVGDVLQRVGYAITATTYVLDPGPAVIL